MRETSTGDTNFPEAPHIVTKTALGDSTSPVLYSPSVSGLADVTEHSVKGSTQKDHEVRVEQYLTDLRARRDARRILDTEDAASLPEPSIKTVDELLATDTPSERIKGLTPSGSMVAIVARAKAGKTTLTLNLVQSLLNGSPFLDRFDVDPEKGSIAYLNYEMSDSLFGSYCKDLGISGDQFRIVGMQGRTSLMKTKASRNKLANRLKGCTSLIVDSFGKAFTGKDQNDNSEVLNWFNELEEFARHDIGINEIYLIVHAGKNLSQGARGASALEDVPDVILTLSLEDQSNPDSRRILESRGRVKDLPQHYLDFNKSTSRLSLGDPKNAELRQSQQREQLQQKIIIYVNENPQTSTKKIRDSIGGNHKAISDELKSLVDAKILQTQKGPHNANLYSLIEQGKGG